MTVRTLIDQNLREQGEQMILEGKYSRSEIAAILSEQSDRQISRQNVGVWVQSMIRRGIEIEGVDRSAYYDMPDAEVEESEQWTIIRLLDADLLLPKQPGVYVIKKSKSGPVIYIGSSGNLFKRWQRGHHSALAAIRAGGTALSYKVVKKYAELEREMIKHYRELGAPLLNGGNRRG